jgi:hypothetical protein
MGRTSGMGTMFEPADVVSEDMGYDSRGFSEMSTATGFTTDSDKIRNPA